MLLHSNLRNLVSNRQLINLRLAVKCLLLLQRQKWRMIFNHLYKLVRLLVTYLLLKPTATDIDAFATFPFLDRQMIDGLKQELPKYLATAEDMSDNVDVVGVG